MIKKISICCLLILLSGCASLRNPQFWEALGGAAQEYNETASRQNTVTVIQHEQKRYRVTDNYGQPVGYATQQPEHTVIYLERN